jgi:predicted DNA-binding transcriptional regulator YafY
MSIDETNNARNTKRKYRTNIVQVIDQQERRRQISVILHHDPNLSNRRLAEQFNVSEATISRDINSLKNASSQVIRDLAKKDIAWAFTQTLDSINSIKAECFRFYHSKENKQDKDRLAALRIALLASVESYNILKDTPSIMAIQSLETRISDLEQQRGITNQQEQPLQQQQQIVRRQPIV